MRAAFFFLIIVSCALAKDNGFLPALEEKFEEIFSDYVGYITKWFQSFNDEHLGKTKMGRMLNYDEMKMKMAESGKHPPEGRSSMKKVGHTMMPLVFHVGAASTWMLLTTLLTAKTLAVGLALLVFKIAAGSAKLASFFTQLKHSNEDHHGYSPAWTPHYEHHVHSAHKRESAKDPRQATDLKLDDTPNDQYRVAMAVSIGTREGTDLDYHIEHHPDHHGTISHNPGWTLNHIPHHTNNEYKNEFHDYKNNEFHESKNDEFHNYKTHEDNEYKTITTHDIKGSNEDFNHLEGH